MFRHFKFLHLKDHYCLIGYLRADALHWQKLNFTTTNFKPLKHSDYYMFSTTCLNIQILFMLPTISVRIFMFLEMNSDYFFNIISYFGKNKRRFITPLCCLSALLYIPPNFPFCMLYVSYQKTVGEYFFPLLLASQWRSNADWN
jgi:hypothetical protein